MLAGVGGSLAWWALTGEGDLSCQAREWFARHDQPGARRHDDLIARASAESFPASDAPSWTPTVGTGLRRAPATPLMLKRCAFRSAGASSSAARAAEVLADNCLGLAAQLAYYFFLALFPALLFLRRAHLVHPDRGPADTITATLARVAPGDVLTIIQDQILKIAQDKDGGLLTLGMLGTIWSTSAGDDGDHRHPQPGLRHPRRPSVVEGPADRGRPDRRPGRLHRRLHRAGRRGAGAGRQGGRLVPLGPAFTWTWKILQWPVVFVLVSVGDCASSITSRPTPSRSGSGSRPGSILATILWLLISLGFRFYVTNFGDLQRDYGAIGGVIVLMLWFYLSGLAVLVGAELNAEIEHASPYGKDPGEKAPGEKKKIGRLAERACGAIGSAHGTFRAGVRQRRTATVDRELPPVPAGRRRVRAERLDSERHPAGVRPLVGTLRRTCGTTALRVPVVRITRGAETRIRAAFAKAHAASRAQSE